MKIGNTVHSKSTDREGEDDDITFKFTFYDSWPNLKTKHKTFVMSNSHVYGKKCQPDYSWYIKFNYKQIPIFYLNTL